VALAPPGALAQARFVLEGVPFVSWSEAADMEYPDKEVLNPSVAAALAMVGRYWGHESLVELMRDEADAWATVENIRDASLGDLKRALRTVGPIVVTPALTPWAHPLPDSIVMLMQAGALKTPRQLRDPPTSRVLGMLGSFRTIQRSKLPADPFLEARRMAARVVIGYDDDEETVLLHDPSFGPALEVSYAEFESMWRPAGAAYVTVLPKDPAAEPARSSAPGLAASTDQRAVRHWVRGYALASIGEIDEAAGEYRRGLDLAGISAGCRHVLLVEMALVHREEGRNAAAIESARQAAEAVPEHYVGWMLLGNLYAESSRANAMTLAHEHTAEAERLMADDRALAVVAETLPRDLLLPWTAARLAGTH
jgi:tetratricopeptide (TPR) repeat protein